MGIIASCKEIEIEEKALGWSGWLCMAAQAISAKCRFPN
jgi:hypothetical protein